MDIKKLKVGKLYKLVYKCRFDGFIYAWDLNRNKCCWGDSYRYPKDSLVLILEIFYVKPFGEHPILKILINGEIRYIEVYYDVKLVRKYGKKI